MSRLFGKPERLERMTFVMEMDGPTAHRLKDSFRKVVKADPCLAAKESGTTVEVKYNFDCEYYGGCAEALDGILELTKDESVVSTVSLKELAHGKSLMVDLVKKIEKLEKRIKKQEA